MSSGLVPTAPTSFFAGAHARVPSPETGVIDEARALGVRPASLARRGCAFAIDLAIAIAAAAPAVVGIGGMLTAAGRRSTTAAGGVSWAHWLLIIGVVLLVVTVIAHLLTHGLRGATAGRAATGVRSVSSTTLAKPGFWRIVLRSLVLCVSGLVPVLGPLAMVCSGPLDPAKAGRNLLDRVGGCWAVDTRGGLDPFDLAALLAARRERDLASIVTREPLVPLGTWDGGGDRGGVARSRAGVVGFAGALAGWDSHQGTDAR